MPRISDSAERFHCSIALGRNREVHRDSPSEPRALPHIHRCEGSGTRIGGGGLRIALTSEGTRGDIERCSHSQSDSESADTRPYPALFPTSQTQRRQDGSDFTPSDAASANSCSSEPKRCRESVLIRCFRFENSGSLTRRSVRPATQSNPRRRSDPRRWRPGRGGIRGGSLRPSLSPRHPALNRPAKAQAWQWVTGLSGVLEKGFKWCAENAD